MRAWSIVDRVETESGTLELRRRGDDDFLITIAGRVLMNSRASRSETGLAELACRAIAGRSAPRVLVGGLGMGCTLRAALDQLPAAASVVVAELSERVVDWCNGPLAAVNASALRDHRCTVRVESVSETIAAAAGKPTYDAIVFDLYEGPGGDDDPLFGRKMLAAIRQVVKPGGVFAVWSEAPNRAFARRLERSGFTVQLRRIGRGGLRHAVYVGRAAAGARS